MSHALARITIGAGLIAGVAALLAADVYLPAWDGIPIAPGFWIVLVAGLLLGAWEFVRMLRVKGAPSRPVIAMGFVVLLIAGAWAGVYWTQLHPRLSFRGLDLYLLLILAMVFTTFLAEIIRVERTGGDMTVAASAIGWTVLIVLVLGLPGVFVAKIRFLPPGDHGDGLLFLILSLAVVKVGDIGAYAIGSTLGRHKLVPALSPKKTVEGLFGAVAAGTAAALAIGCATMGFTWAEMLVFGVVVSVAGVLGDLAESLLKRACGVKDSGAIPGFGGALDILDSVLGAIPVAYLVLVVLTGRGH